jgi:hypothetical protein
MFAGPREPRARFASAARGRRMKESKLVNFRIPRLSVDRRYCPDFEVLP